MAVAAAASHAGLLGAGMAVGGGGGQSLLQAAGGLGRPQLRRRAPPAETALSRRMSWDASGTGASKPVACMSWAVHAPPAALQPASQPGRAADRMEGAGAEGTHAPLHAYARP